MRNAHGQSISTSIAIESLYSGMIRVEDGLSGMTELWVLPADRNSLSYTDGAIDLLRSRGVRFACRHEEASAFWIMCS